MCQDLHQLKVENSEYALFLELSKKISAQGWYISKTETAQVQGLSRCQVPSTLVKALEY